MKKKALNLFFVLLLLGMNSFAQEHDSKIQNYLNNHVKDLGITKSDATNWKVYNQHFDKSSNISYVYLLQTHKDIEVFNAIANFAITENAIVLGGNRLINDVEGKVNSTEPAINASEAIASACRALSIQQNYSAELIKTDDGISLFKKGSISKEDIPVKLVYVPDGDVVKLAWDLSIYELSGNHWWSIRIDALTGQEINKGDWVTSCKFDSDGHNHSSTSAESQFKTNPPTASPLMLPAPPPATNSYRVFEIPTESPNHGPRTLVVGPSDATASPYGWHNISGSGGSEFTITTGNNVRASEDEDGNDGIGYWPDAGAPLIFDYPLDLNQAANQYWDASITNLFYMNNIMHDVWYHYGFDEASGNFQANSFGNGGLSSDQVYAEAQDGSGTNNANFSTPPDGQNPRMQMYLWDTPADLLTINTPAGIAGTYAALPAAFGAPVPTIPLISDLVLYDDNTGVDFNDACEVPVNGAAINGNICVIRRGDCFFSDKILKAEAAGATAVIMVNNVNTGVISMGDGGTGSGITIPAIFISKADGDLIIAMMESGTTVNGTIDQTVSIPVDGDFDNGIIAHEYGHGISTRLTGGAANSGCLGNLEQMGEGWSDWFGLMLTIEPGDQATDIRGIGTFASSQGINGIGIRPAPYSTDLAVNNYTYDATNWDGNTGPETISEPHGIGFVWCTMLWDMTWALIDNYGYDTDLYNGTGGNNIAMELVIQGLKLQACDPGFEDGRDAILQADELLNGGANQCLIWNVFANRGLGYSAFQGNTNSRSDQTEAFDMPPGMVDVSGSESVTSCIDYTWSANGTTYTSNGNYVETLLSSNGCDSIATLNLTILNATTSSNAVTACETYNWNGTDYITSGNYTWEGTNAAGCDSVATLNLTIDSAPSASISSFTDPTTCAGLEGTITIGAIGTGIISWSSGATSGNSGTVTTPYIISGLGSGNYSITFDNGCPSSVVNQGLISPGATTSDVAVTECITYNWNGDDYTLSGIYSWTGLNAISCDSVATLNLTINNPTVSNSTVTECDNYNWNGTDYITSGAYTWAGTNTAGCDSTANLTLIINNVDVSTSFVDDFTMTSDIAGAAYAWIDCNDNNSLISGATSQTYTATYNGEFAVIVTEGGCSDTSVCMTVSTIGIVENNFGMEINVYPNPTSENVTIDLGAEYSNIEIRVTNALGQIIDSKLITASNSIDITLDGASGTYILEITTENDVTARVRVVKQ